MKKRTALFSLLDARLEAQRVHARRVEGGRSDGERQATGRLPLGDGNRCLQQLPAEERVAPSDPGFSLAEGRISEDSARPFRRMFEASRARAEMFHSAAQGMQLDRLVDPSIREWPQRNDDTQAVSGSRRGCRASRSGRSW